MHKQEKEVKLMTTTAEKRFGKLNQNELQCKLCHDTGAPQVRLVICEWRWVGDLLKMSQTVPREYIIVLEMPTPNKMMANDVTCFKNLKLNSHNVSDRVPDTFLTQKSKHCKRKKADIYTMKF